MALIAPVRDERGHVIAALGLGIDAEESFSRPLEVARAGETGETYAFSEDGTLLSESRFEPQLRAIGLLPDDPQVQSFMNVQIRDPGGDLTQGFQPDRPLQARPFTRMAAAAIVTISAIQEPGPASGPQPERGRAEAGAPEAPTDATSGEAAVARSASSPPRCSTDGSKRMRSN